MLVGYARKTHFDPNLLKQKSALIKAGVEPGYIFEDWVESTRANRIELKNCFKALRAGDLLIVNSLHILARNTKELASMAVKIAEQNIGLKSLEEDIEITGENSLLIAHTFEALNKFNKDLISERTIAGLKAARKNNRSGGRKMKLSIDQIKMAKIMLNNEDITAIEVANIFGISKPTLYRAIKLLD